MLLGTTVRLVASSAAFVFLLSGALAQPAPPIFITGRVQTWNASDPIVPYCDGGLISALARALDTDPEALNSLFSGLLGVGAPLPPAPVDGAVYPSLRRGVEFAESDARASESFLGPAMRNMRLLGALVQSERLGEAIRHVLGVAGPQTRLPDLGQLLQDLEAALLLLQSNTYSEFLLAVTGKAVGGRPSGSGSVALSTKDGFKSPMVNLIDAYCAAAESGLTSDPQPLRPMCSIINLLSSILVCRDDEVVQCPNVWPDSYDVYMPDVCVPPGGPFQGLSLEMKNFVAKFDLEDLRGQGTVNLETAKVLQKEGFEYFLLFRSIRGTNAYKDLYGCGLKGPLEPVIPGWDITHVFSYTPEGSVKQKLRQTPDIPLILLSRGPDVSPCQFVFSVRPTESKFDWSIDLDTPLVPVIRDGIKAHRGFVRLVNSFWPGMKMELGRILEKDAGVCLDTEFIITGHSLGGGVAILLAAMLADAFPTVKVTSVAIAGPNVFNEDGITFFEDEVNGRNIIMDLDPIGAAPCSAEQYPSGFPRCDGINLNAPGFDKYATNLGRVQVDLNSQMGQKDHMDFTTLGWLRAEFLQSLMIVEKIVIDADLPPPLQIEVAHSCAYSCVLSKYCDPNMAPQDAWECTPATCGGGGGRLPPLHAELCLMDTPCP